MPGQWLLLAPILAAAVAARLLLTPRLWAFLLLFIVLFPKLPLAAIPGNTTPLRVDDFVMAVAVAWWGLQILVRPRYDVPVSPVSRFLTLYLATALICTLVGIAGLTTDVFAGAFHFVRLVEYALLYYLFYRTLPPEDLPRLLRVMRFALLMVAGIWVFQRLTAGPPMTDATIDWNSLYPTFSATYDFGGFLMIATLLIYAWWLHREARSVWLSVSLLIGVVMLTLAESRAAFTGALVALLFDLLFRRRFRIAMALGVAIVAAPLLMSASKVGRLIGLLLSFSPQAVLDAFYADPSIAYRLTNWQNALERWAGSPIFGEGLGAYLRYTQIYNLPGTPDGWYIRLLAETGLVGLIAFAILIGSMVWTLLRAYRHDPRPAAQSVLYGAVLVIVGTSINAIFIDAFVSFKIMGTFWAVIAAATRVAAEAELEPSAHPAPLPRLHPVRA